MATPWGALPEALVSELEVEPRDGLSTSEAAIRLERAGPNELPRPTGTPAWRILLNQLASLVVWLLVAAAAVSFAMGDHLEGVAIAAAIIITIVLGFATELRAVRSMSALRELGVESARVRRDGVVRMIEAREVVPGDVLVLEGGDRVCADARIIEASRFQTNESILTGESTPVGKHPDSLAIDCPLAERANMVFKGTTVSRGSGIAIATGTGIRTEIGHIAELVDATGDEETPLERELAALGRKLIWACLAMAMITATVGGLGGRDPSLMLKTAIALAIAAIPEGLPVVATIALARGLWRLASRHALIKRLSSVETLGATDIILVDKTGTLTANELSVVACVVDGVRIDRVQDAPRELLELAALCNNASLDGDEASGDPLEVALMRAARQAGITGEVLARSPRVREEAFDPVLKMMATVHRSGAEHLVAAKGAPEAILDACSPIDADVRAQILASSEELASGGLRVLALASRRAPDIDAVYERLSFAGLVAFADPPRTDVAGPIAACREAGIRVVMATGDQAATAASIATAVGLAGDAPQVMLGTELDDRDNDVQARLATTDVFARVTPGQKLELVEHFIDEGLVVAMTGDGVNDAPALRRAAIGIAMGRRGTDVAREAADMVLVDDSFESIVVAIEQGRAIFENIRRFVLFLLSCNLAEVLVVSGAIIVGAPLPLLPLQVLFLNLVTDVFPALALGFGEGSPSAMKQQPRPASEPIMAARHWWSVLGFASLITAATLGAMAIALAVGGTAAQATSVSFLTLGFAQLWHVINMRDRRSPLRSCDVVRNPWVWGSLVLCTVLLIGAAQLTPLSAILDVVAIGAEGWAIVVGMSLLPLIAGQLFALLRR